MRERRKSWLLRPRQPAGLRSSFAFIQQCFISANSIAQFTGIISICSFLLKLKINSSNLFISLKRIDLLVDEINKEINERLEWNGEIGGLWAGGPSTAHQLIPQSTLIVSFMLLALPLLINERDEPSPKSIFYFFLCWMSKDGRNVVNWLSEMGWKLITNHCAIKKDLSFLWSRQLTIHQFTIPSIK